eukprot:8733-Heterococcus_DN1.PRE.2
MGMHLAIVVHTQWHYEVCISHEPVTLDTPLVKKWGPASQKQPLAMLEVEHAEPVALWREREGAREEQQ